MRWRARKAEYLAAGMDDYISKPVQPELLFAKLALIAGRTRGCRAGPAAAGRKSISTSLPVLDLEQLGALTNSLSLEMVRDFLGLFLTDTLSHIAAIAPDDLQAAARDAHAVVSAAGNLGVVRLCAAGAIAGNGLPRGRRENGSAADRRIAGARQGERAGNPRLAFRA